MYVCIYVYRVLGVPSVRAGGQTSGRYYPSIAGGGSMEGVEIGSNKIGDPFLSQLPQGLTQYASIPIPIPFVSIAVDVTVSLTLTFRIIRRYIDKRN